MLEKLNREGDHVILYTGTYYTEEGKRRKVVLNEQCLLVLVSFKQLEPVGGKIFSKSQVAKLIHTILL